MHDKDFADGGSDRYWRMEKSSFCSKAKDFSKVKMWNIGKARSDKCGEIRSAEVRGDQLDQLNQLNQLTKSDGKL